MRDPISATACLLTALLAACSPPADGPGGVVVFDSAGVTIVENTLEAVEAAPRWKVGPAPLLEVGTVEGEGPAQFSMIRGVERLSDGGLVVLDAQTRELRWFEPDGRHRATSGGTGDGPGELGSNASPAGPFLINGDTVLVWDPNSQRATLFDRNGVFLATVSSAGSGGWLPQPVGFLTSRRAAVRSGTATARPGDPEAMRTNQQVLQLAEVETGASDTIAVVGDLGLFQWSTEATVGFTPVPFTVDAATAVSAGRIVTTVDARPLVHVYDEAGALERIIRTNGELEPLTSSRFEAEVDARVGLASEEARDDVRRRHRGMPVRSHVPAFGALLPGPGGELWLERYRSSYGRFPRPREPSEWVVFDADGAVAGQVTFPAGFAPHRISHDGVLGVYRNQLDVEFVWLLELFR